MSSKQLLKNLNHRPIAYYPVYRKIMGSVAGGVYLSQLMYWFSTHDKFYKTDTEIRSETGLSPDELRTAKNKLKTLGIISITREGPRGKTHYEIDWDAFAECVAAVSFGESHNQDSVSGISPNLFREIPETYINTEITKKREKEKKRKREKEKAEINQYPEPLQEWIEYRKQIRKPLKQKTIERLFRDFQQDPGLFAMKVEYSIMNGYQGLFAPQANKAGPSTPPVGSLNWEIEQLSNSSSLIDTEVSDG